MCRLMDPGCLSRSLLCGWLVTNGERFQHVWSLIIATTVTTNEHLTVASLPRLARTVQWVEIHKCYVCFCKQIECRKQQSHRLPQAPSIRARCSNPHNTRSAFAFPRYTWGTWFWAKAPRRSFKHMLSLFCHHWVACYSLCQTSCSRLLLWSSCVSIV